MIPDNSISYLQVLRLRIQDIYINYGQSLFILSLFLLPIKLSWFLAAYVPLSICWLINTSTDWPRLIRAIKRKHTFPFFLFVLTAFIASFFGLDPIRSLGSLSSLTYYSLIILISHDLLKKTGFIKPAFFLFFGQTIAGIHSIITTSFSLQLNDFLPGPVTESGQIALVLIFALGVGFHLRNKIELTTGISPAFPTIRLLIPIVTFSIFATITLGQSHLNHSFLAILIVAGASIVIGCLFEGLTKKQSLGSERVLLYLLLEIIIPILFLTLVINLKRGPWAGVFVGSLILFSMFSRRMILPIMLTTLSLSIFLPPVRERLSHSYDHFLISGGRKAIWDIGSELTVQYPLGIGLRNSPVLRKFSTEIPPELKHFHNNLLNISVETGLVGLSIFIWWILALLTLGWSTPKNSQHAILARAAACSIISWQVAGLVEYNFGDSEVILIVFFIIGLLSFATQEDSNESTALS